MINKRLFGTPIEGDVRRKLEARQQIAGDLKPGESLDGTKMINGVFTNVDGNIEADLSSRTPFVRMWTSLKLIEPEVLADAAVTEITKEEIAATSPEEAVAKAINIKKDALGVEYTETSINKIKDKDGKLIKIIIKDKNHRDQVDYVRKTYIVGDYNYQTSYGSVDSNESLQTIEDDSTQVGELLFPQQLKDNPLIKPQAGITGLSVETGDTLGVIKTTTINFVVHNFIDFDRIYNKYFLKPGATIFVDYGWSSVKNLYDPVKLIESTNESGGIQEYLYGESTLGQVDGQVTKNQGDLDVIQGIVKDYTAKILPNGSVDCTLTLTSANSVLLNFNIHDDFQYKLKKILTRGVLFYGIGAIAVQSKDQALINALFSTPKKDASIEDFDDYDIRLINQAVLQLGSTPTPSGNSIRSGVYIDSLNVDNVYITWGVFEDLIVNSQFAFGKSQSDISNGTGFQVKMDSSNTMTKWSSLYVDNQTVLLQIAEKPPMFLFPEWWNTSDPGENGTGSYTLRKNKWPEEFYSDKYSDKVSPVNNTEEDKKLEIIPLREVFINVDIIIEAFRNEQKIKKIINKILRDLNESSPLFNLKMRKGVTEAQVEIVDMNMVEAEIRAKLLKEDDALRYFTFNIMSPNSIVKDYNLELKIPDDDIGNYYALQATSHDNNLFSVDPKVKEAINTLGFDSDSKSLIYEPDNGGYRAEQNLDKKSDTEAFDVFETLKPLIDAEIIKTANSYTIDDGEQTTPDINKKVVPTPISTAAKMNFDLSGLQKIVERNEEHEIFKGNKVANSVTEYYYIKIFGEQTTEISDLMPYTLSLTTYGISSIQPGDTFRVDYLPKVYLKNSYVQTMKVIHNINADGWFTTLDTQFRTKIENNIKQQANQESKGDDIKVVLSPKAFSKMNLNHGRFRKFMSYNNVDDAAFKDFPVILLEPMMVGVTIEPYYGNENKKETYASGILLKFKTPKKFEKALLPTTGVFIDRQSLYSEFMVKDPTKEYQSTGDGIVEGDHQLYIDCRPILESYRLSYINNPPKGPKVGYEGSAESVLIGTPGDPVKNPAADYDKPFIYGSKYGFKPHRVYPPSIRFEEDTNYEMLIVNQNYAIFQVDKHTPDRLNQLKRFFTLTDSKIKTQATRTDRDGEETSYGTSSPTIDEDTTYINNSLENLLSGLSEQEITDLLKKGKENGSLIPPIIPPAVNVKTSTLK